MGIDGWLGGILGGATAAVMRGWFVAGWAAGTAFIAAHVGRMVLENGAGLGGYGQVVEWLKYETGYLVVVTVCAIFARDLTLGSVFEMLMILLYSLMGFELLYIHVSPIDVLKGGAVSL